MLLVTTIGDSIPNGQWHQSPVNNIRGYCESSPLTAGVYASWWCTYLDSLSNANRCRANIIDILSASTSDSPLRLRSIRTSTKIKPTKYWTFEVGEWTVMRTVALHKFAMQCSDVCLLLRIFCKSLKFRPIVSIEVDEDLLFSKLLTTYQATIKA